MGLFGGVIVCALQGTSFTFLKVHIDELNMAR